MPSHPKSRGNTAIGEMPKWGELEGRRGGRGRIKALSMWTLDSLALPYGEDAASSPSEMVVLQ